MYQLSVNNQYIVKYYGVDQLEAANWMRVVRWSLSDIMMAGMKVYDE